MNGSALARAALASVLVASLAAAWFVAASVRRGTNGPPPETPPGLGDRTGPESAAERLDVRGLVGEMELSETVRLQARVVRLHASELAQRFDAEALRRRLHLPDGEPFVCELRLGGTRLAAAVECTRIRVVDDGGDALVPFSSSDGNPNAGGGASSRPADPLTTLLAPPGEPLHGGESITIALWGREPRTNAHIVGLEDSTMRGDPTRAEGISIALSAAALAPSVVDTSLARVGRPSASAPASNGGR